MKDSASFCGCGGAGGADGLLDHLYNEGCSIISTGTCTFSMPMTEAEIDTLVEAFKSGFAQLASMG